MLLLLILALQTNFYGVTGG